MAASADRISGLPDELLCHILSFLPSSQIALTSLLSKRWNPLWLAMPNADRISALPEQVLCRIIKLLPMKQIFATSLLSKRWRPLCRRIDNINLDDRTYMDDLDTWHYYRMGSVFLFNIQIPIKCFNLVSASLFCRSSKLDTFIHLLVNRNVEHVNLILNFLQQPSIVYLQYKILTCTTLVVLKLNGLTIDYVDRLFTNLPKLEILHLTKVHILKLKFLIKILSLCPLLEDLLMKNLQVTDNTLAADDSTQFVITFPNLLKADISESSISCFFRLKLFRNVDFLCAQVAVHTLEEDFSATKFLNLTHMELRFEEEYYWDCLIKFICACPSLQSLVIHKIGGGYGLLSDDDDDKNWLHPQFVPECFSSQLQMFSFINYGGNESELQFTKYIIQNATVLRSVKIYRNTSSNPPEEQRQMIKELYLCQRSSVLRQPHFEWI